MISARSSDAECAARLASVKEHVEHVEHLREIGVREVFGMERMLQEVLECLVRKVFDSLSQNIILVSCAAGESVQGVDESVQRVGSDAATTSNVRD
jgi:hypothetical protein